MKFLFMGSFEKRMWCTIGNLQIKNLKNLKKMALAWSHAFRRYAKTIASFNCRHEPIQIQFEAMDGKSSVTGAAFLKVTASVIRFPSCELFFRSWGFSMDIWGLCCTIIGWKILLLISIYSGQETLASRMLAGAPIIELTCGRPCLWPECSNFLNHASCCCMFPSHMDTL